MSQEVFGTKKNPEKAAARVAVNGVMLASLFVVLAVIFLEPDKFPLPAIAQLVWAIPLLFVSSLAYAKVGYWQKTKPWDSLGYFTATLGNFLMINAVGIMIATISELTAFLYFSLVVCLMSIYSLVNIIYHEDRKWQMKFLKLVFSMTILFVGGILPLL